MSIDAFNPENARVVNLISQDSFTSIQASLEKSYHVDIIDGSEIADLASFYNAFSEQILDGFEVHNLSSLEDGFYQHVVLSDKSKTALIWTNTHNMLQGGLEDLLKIAEVFMSFAYKMKKKGHRHINIFLGDGPNFSS